jgi:hypothetical protein
LGRPDEAQLESIAQDAEHLERAEHVQQLETVEQDHGQAARYRVLLGHA